MNKGRPKIKIPLNDAQTKIKIQIRRGKTISKFTIKDLSDLKTVEDRRSEWYDYTKNLLEEIDENLILVNDFHYLTQTIMVGTRSIQDRVNDFRESMDKDVNNLQSISKHIEIMKEIKKKSSTKKDKKRSLTHAEKTWMWENKSHECYICHKDVEKRSEAYFDHTKAHAKKGETTPANSAITHGLCNRLKGKKSLKEIQKYLGTDLPKKQKPSVESQMRNLRKISRIINPQPIIHNKELHCGCWAKDTIIVKLCQMHRQQYIGMNYEPPEGYYRSEDHSLL